MAQPTEPLRASDNTLFKIRESYSRIPFERRLPPGCTVVKDRACNGYCRWLGAFCKDFVNLCRPLSKRTSDPAGFRSRFLALAKRGRQVATSKPRVTVKSVEHSVLKLLVDFSTALRDDTILAIRQGAYPGTDPQIDFGVTTSELNQFLKSSAVLVDFTRDRGTHDSCLTTIYSIVACLFHGNDRTINALVESRAFRKTLDLAHRNGVEREGLMKNLGFDRSSAFRMAVCSLLENALWALNARKDSEKRQRPLAEQFLSSEQELYQMLTFMLKERPLRKWESLHRRVIGVLRLRRMLGGIMSVYRAEMHEAMLDILPVFCAILRTTWRSISNGESYSTNVECLQILEIYFKEDVKAWRAGSDNRPVVPHVGVENIVPIFVSLLRCDSRCIRVRALSVINAFFESVTQPDTAGMDADNVQVNAKVLALALCLRFKELTEELKREISQPDRDSEEAKQEQGDAKVSLILDNARWWKWEMSQQDGKAPRNMCIAEFELLGQVFGYLTAREGFGAHVLKRAASVIDERIGAMSLAIHFWCKTLHTMDPSVSAEAADECGKIARGLSGLIVASEKLGARLFALHSKKTFDLGALVLRLLPHNIESASILGLSLVRDPALRTLPSLTFPSTQSFLSHSRRLEASQLTSFGNGVRLCMTFFLSLFAPNSANLAMLTNYISDPFACMTFLTGKYLAQSLGTGWLSTYIYGQLSPKAGATKMKYMHCIDVWMEVLKYIDDGDLQTFLVGVSSRSQGEPVSSRTHSAALAMLRSMRQHDVRLMKTRFETYDVLTAQEVDTLCNFYANDWMFIHYVAGFYSAELTPVPSEHAEHWEAIGGAQGQGASAASRAFNARLSALTDLMRLQHTLGVSIEDTEAVSECELAMALIGVLLGRQPEEAPSPWEVQQIYLVALEEMTLSCELDFLSRADVTVDGGVDVAAARDLVESINEWKMRDVCDMVEHCFGAAGDTCTWRELDRRLTSSSCRSAGKKLVDSVIEVSKMCGEYRSKIASLGKFSDRDRALPSLRANSDSSTIRKARLCYKALQSQDCLLTNLSASAIVEVLDNVVFIRGQIARLSPIAHVGVRKQSSFGAECEGKSSSAKCADKDSKVGCVSKGSSGTECVSKGSCATECASKCTSFETESKESKAGCLSKGSSFECGSKRSCAAECGSKGSSGTECVDKDSKFECGSSGSSGTDCGSKTSLSSALLPRCAPGANRSGCDPLDVLLLSLANDIVLPAYGEALCFKDLIQSRIARGEKISQELVDCGLKIKQMDEDSELFAASMQFGMTSHFATAVKDVHSRLLPHRDFFDSPEGIAIERNCKDFYKVLRLNHSGALWASIWVPDTPVKLSAKARRIVSCVNASINQYGRIRALLLLYGYISPSHYSGIFGQIHEKLPGVKISSHTLLGKQLWKQLITWKQPKTVKRVLGERWDDAMEAKLDVPHILEGIKDACRLYDYEAAPLELFSFEKTRAQRRWPFTVSEDVEDVLEKLFDVVATEEPSDSLASRVIDFISKFGLPRDSDSVVSTRQRSSLVTDLCDFSTSLIAELPNRYADNYDGVFCSRLLMMMQPMYRYARWPDEEIELVSELEPGDWSPLLVDAHREMREALAEGVSNDSWAAGEAREALCRSADVVRKPPPLGPSPWLSLFDHTALKFVTQTKLTTPATTSSKTCRTTSSLAPPSASIASVEGSEKCSAEPQVAATQEQQQTSFTGVATRLRGLDLNPSSSSREDPRLSHVNDHSTDNGSIIEHVGLSGTSKVSRERQSAVSSGAKPREPFPREPCQESKTPPSKATSKDASRKKSASARSKHNADPDGNNTDGSAALRKQGRSKSSKVSQQLPSTIASGAKPKSKGRSEAGSRHPHESGAKPKAKGRSDAGSPHPPESGAKPKPNKRSDAGSRHSRRSRSASVCHPCENPRCAKVDSLDDRFQRCGACSKRYCSTECSKVDWKRHRKECAGHIAQKRSKAPK